MLLMRWNSFKRTTKPAFGVRIFQVCASLVRARVSGVVECAEDLGQASLYSARGDDEREALETLHFILVMFSSKEASHEENPFG